jgi:sugar/nucleoside kinase (ribokinase family)
MFDIITFGSATRDNFLKLKKGSFKVSKSKSSSSGKVLSFSYGSKIDVDSIKVFTGGGGTNAAATFTAQKLRTACIVKIGDDKRGEAIIEGLKKKKISTRFIIKDKNFSTDYSSVLSVPGKERTILVYHGASRELNGYEIDWKKIKSKWFYIAPMHGKSAELLDELSDYAKSNNIKIAINPGNTQINLGMKRLKHVFSNVDILILNLEEASLLTKTSIKKEQEIIKKLKKIVKKGICVITKGGKGSIVYDGRYLYEAGIPESSFVEKTGAGDAFSSGFVSEMIRSNDIVEALQLGTANATSCIQKLGAKNGLLKKGEMGNWPRVPIKKKEL